MQLSAFPREYLPAAQISGTAVAASATKNPGSAAAQLVEPVTFVYLPVLQSRHPAAPDAGE